MSQGSPLWCFGGPSEPVPVIYHVPEMNESLIRHYMHLVGVPDDDNFLVRPMESGLWTLDDPRMLRSAEGRCVFLDTAGYFNPADDASNYQQVIKFSALIHNLMTAGGALAVVGLYHPRSIPRMRPSGPWRIQCSARLDTGTPAKLLAGAEPQRGLERP